MVCDVIGVGYQADGGGVHDNIIVVFAQFRNQFSKTTTQEHFRRIRRYRPGRD